VKKESFPTTAAPERDVDLPETFPKTPALVSYYTRCGKPRCRCRQGSLHGPYWQLRWREVSTQRRRYVRPGDLAGVQAAIAQRRAHRQRVRRQMAASMQMLTRLSFGAPGPSYGLWAAFSTGDDMLDDELDAAIAQILEQDRETLERVLADLEPQQALIDEIIARDREQLDALLRDLEQQP
jgi:hypothetical protein